MLFELFDWLADYYGAFRVFGYLTFRAILAALSALGVAIGIVMLGWTTEQKERAEEGMRRSDRRFRALVQHADRAAVSLEELAVRRPGSLERLRGVVEEIDVAREARAAGEDVVGPGLVVPSESHVNSANQVDDEDLRGLGGQDHGLEGGV